MASAVGYSKAVVLLLLIYCLLLLPLFVGDWGRGGGGGGGPFLFCNAVQYLVSILIFAIISLRKRELVA